MKKILLIIALLIGLNSFSQSPWVTNWQLQAGTWRTIAEDFKSNAQFSDFVAFIKVFNNFKGNNHNDNVPITLDSIPTVMVAILYEKVLFDVAYGDILENFQTSLTSKRGTNSLLNTLCTALETRLNNMRSGKKAAGNKLLTGN